MRKVIGKKLLSESFWNVTYNRGEMRSPNRDVIDVAKISLGSGSPRHCTFVLMQINKTSLVAD